MSDEEHYNIWENKNSTYMPPPTEYKDLGELISFQSFDYDRYREHEITKLQPQLEYLGYTNIEWSMGDHDTWGPLTRVCRAKDHFGQVVWFVYG